MPGRGAPPKPPDQRARRNKDPIPLRVIHVDPTGQPPLPDSVEWHPQTLAWWEMWGDSPLAEMFTDNDWSELTLAAVLHSAFWSGESRVGPELRLRTSKFGATPEDRARLRIQCVTADVAESKAGPRVSDARSSRDKYSAPKAV